MHAALSECIRVGGEAISLENANRNYEAYRKYLFCCLKAFGALSSEVNDMKQDNYAIRLKLSKMANQCAERILSYCEKPDVRHLHGSSQNTQAQPSLPSFQNSQAVPRPPTTPTSAAVSRQASVAKPTTSSAVVSDGAKDTDDPEALARMQNRLMLEHHRRLMETANYSPTRMANLTLSLQKKMLENLELARKKKTLLDYQLLERQKRLKEMADRRIAAVRISDPAKEKQHNDLLTAIFLHDDKHKEISSLKQQISRNGVFNCENANQLCQRVLGSETHPLAILLKDCQVEVEEVARPLYIKYHVLVTGCLKVPFTSPEEPQLTDSPTDTVTDDIEESSATNDLSLNDVFERNCNIAADEVKAALYKTDKDINKLLEDPSTSELMSDNMNESNKMSVSEEPNENDDMDSLFDSDEETNDRESAICHSEPMADLADKPDNREVCITSDSDLQALVELEDSAAAFTENVQHVTKSIHGTMHSLRTLFNLAYDGFNCTQGQDIIASQVQKYLFSSIGDHLQLLYRLVNLGKEKCMAQVMTRYRDEGISSMKVKEKWLLGTSGECYHHLCAGLIDMVSAASPLQKMSCAVGVNKGVVETTAEYYSSRDGGSVMGADDLLPIICYILMKSQLPQIVSQCAIMEEFIPAEYMMEEEGYALTTVMMAMQYLLTL